MIIKGQTDYKYHIKKALNKMQNVNKWQSDFILEIYLLFLSIKGRMNFLQFGRYLKSAIKLLIKKPINCIRKTYIVID